MKVSAQPLSKLNTIISDDGRLAKITAVVKTGQSLAFTIQHDQVGILIQRLQLTARAMRERLFGAADSDAAAVISDALTRPGTVSSVAVARDAQTGDTLLWIETAECGTYPLRFNNDALATLHSALHEHEKVTDVEAFRYAAE